MGTKTINYYANDIINIVLGDATIENESFASEIGVYDMDITMAKVKGALMKFKENTKLK